MIKHIVFLFVCFVIIPFNGCKKKEIIEYYPSKDFFLFNDLIEIDLDNSKLSFMKITHLVNNSHIKDSTPFITITENNVIKKIMPLRNDWGYRNENNILRVGKDSIYKEGRYSIRELYRILKKHYENNGAHPLYAQSAERAWVEIEIDTNDTGLELKKVMHNVIKTFDKVNKHHNNSLQLKVGLSFFQQTTLPPFPPPSNEKTSVILEYLDSNITQKMDIRIYNLLPPPGVKEVLPKKGKFKNDSIINNLKPLHVYINDSIVYNPNFKLTEKGVKGFSFLKEEMVSKKESVFLDISALKERKGVFMQSIGQEKFFKLYPDIFMDDNYGGLVSFQNLFFSEDGKKAYFEVVFFKENLNSSTNAVYAEFKNNKWVFKSIEIAMS